MKLWDMYTRSTTFRTAEGGEISKESASLFVSGIILKAILFSDITYTGRGEEFTFEQMWYLICLHHDISFEQRKVWEMICCDISGSRSLVPYEGKSLEIQCKWSPLPVIFSPNFTYEEGSIEFGNGARVRKSILTESEIRDIFYFRNTCCKTMGMDHGIAGGLLLYENLVQQSYEIKKRAERNSRDLYSYLANTLMVHNLLKMSEDGLRYTIREDPMLCLLLIAEALEPLQYVNEYKNEGVTAEKILDCIQIEIEEKKLILQVTEKGFPFETYAENIARAAEITGLGCDTDRPSSRICVRRDESAIIDEIFI